MVARDKMINYSIIWVAPHTETSKSSIPIDELVVLQFCTLRVSPCAIYRNIVLEVLMSYPTLNG